MIYCVSDIHGELDKFERLLTLIQFSENDHLHVIGDAIDRCAMGVDILRLVMDTSNMTMLLGNHEQMCLATLGLHNEFGARELWRRNGGSSTYRELFYHRTPHERNMILRFSSFTLFMVVPVLTVIRASGDASSQKIEVLTRTPSASSATRRSTS